MSPVNSDDSAGEVSGGGRPLTRKEIRAREKLQTTQGHSIIPPQAFETGPAGDPTPPETAQQMPSKPEPAQPEPSLPQHSLPQPADPQTMTQPAQPPADAPGESYPGDAGDEPAIDSQDHPQAAPTVHEPETTALYTVAADNPAPAADNGYYDHHEDAPTGPYAETEAHYVYQDAGLHPAGTYSPDGQPGVEYHGDDGEDLMARAASRAPKGPSKKIRRRRRFLALVLTLTLFVVAFSVGSQLLKPLLGADAVADYPGPGTGEVTITVPPGSGAKAVADELRAKNVVASADAFLKDFMAAGGALSPGDFSMREEMKNSDAVAVLLDREQGKVMYIALSAGLRVNESLQAISEGTGVSVPELTALSNDPAQFGVPSRAKNLEGFLAPGEYRFPLGTSATDILQKLVTTTLDELKAQGITDPAKQYDVVTVASIVQAEGGQAEYGDVAGAIYNRLKPTNTETNGLIQSDATVTYGLGIRSFHIDEDQKADKTNPYNTYANTGLPAGPIGSPGKTAIDAAAKPTSNDYMYWVTINLDTKETKFSSTLAQHNVYVAQYNAWCNDNPGRCV
ncbi:MAG: endolytic transglycosylase MltG [Arthrobacter oryzae]